MLKLLLLFQCKANQFRSPMFSALGPLNFRIVSFSYMSLLLQNCLFASETQNFVFFKSYRCIESFPSNSMYKNEQYEEHQILISCT
jgi:hypothetical protein